MRFLLIGILTNFFSLFLFSYPTFSNPPLVYLTQTAAHPALDNARRGIVDSLAAQGFKDPKTVRLPVEIAQGQSTLALQIAQKGVGQGAKVLVAIGTTMAQACARAALVRKTPVVFVSVTDPVGAKLVKDLQVPGGNITGVSDATPSRAQIEMFLKLVPNLKKLGVVLNPGEANSLALFASLQKAAQEKGVTLVQGVAMKTCEVGQAARRLVGEVDALFVDNDNTALAAFSSIVSVSQQYKIPLFVSDTDIVEQGALAALGPDQYALGRQTGDMVVRVLKGADPGKIPVAFAKESFLVLNKKAAKILGMTLSQEVLKEAKEVIE